MHYCCHGEISPPHACIKLSSCAMRVPMMVDAVVTPALRPLSTAESGPRKEGGLTQCVGGVSCGCLIMNGSRRIEGREGGREEKGCGRGRSTASGIADSLVAQLERKREGRSLSSAAGKEAMPIRGRCQKKRFHSAPSSPSSPLVQPCFSVPSTALGEDP